MSRCIDIGSLDIPDKPLITENSDSGVVWEYSYIKGSHRFKSADGGIEISVKPEVAETWAKVQWEQFLSRAPDVICIGSQGGKSLIPGHVYNYVAAHNMNISAKNVTYDARTKRMLSTEPPEVTDFSGRRGKQEVEFGISNRAESVDDVHSDSHDDRQNANDDRAADHQ